ncbi:MAG: MoaD/ThiS family protein [Firmicutes bacterium]|nr:MoaD/ThiS family protein [Bacillota bacterium]
MDSKNSVEVRGFSYLKEIFDQRGWPFPVWWPLERECSAKQLAAMMELPGEKIETVFVNGRAGPLSRTISPGDRVAFVPPGTPGPYRVILGLINSGQEKEKV